MGNYPVCAGLVCTDLRKLSVSFPTRNLRSASEIQYALKFAEFYRLPLEYYVTVYNAVMTCPNKYDQYKCVPRSPVRPTFSGHLFDEMYVTGKEFQVTVKVCPLYSNCIITWEQMKTHAHIILSVGCPSGQHRKLSSGRTNAGYFNTRSKKEIQYLHVAESAQRCCLNHHGSWQQRSPSRNCQCSLDHLHSPCRPVACKNSQQ